MWVEFKLATRAQLRDLFMHIYAPLTPPITEIQWYWGKRKTVVSPDEDRPLMARETLGVMAKDFADKLPDGELSPAQVQGFLMKRKNEPRKALDEVEKLIDELKRAKECKARAEQESEKAVEKAVEKSSEAPQVNGDQSKSDAEVIQVGNEKSKRYELSNLLRRSMLPR